MGLYRKKVAVIGAGASGLVATKELIEAGHDVITFEQLQEVGGLWNYRPEIPKLSNEYVLACYKLLQLNSCNLTSCFSDFPNKSKDGLAFPTHSEFVPYLYEYADKFDLKKYIRFGCEVTALKKKNERWVVFYKKSSGSKKLEVVVDRIVVAMRYGMPHMPRFKNIKEYKGNTIHSSEWRGNEIFDKKEILIVGGSVSGADAVEKSLKSNVKNINWILSEKPSSVLWAFNRYPHKNKIPLDHILNRFDAFFPNRSQKFANDYTYLIAKEKLARKPNLYTDKACVVDTDIVDNGIKNGRVNFVSGIDKFTKDSVILKDGKLLQPDLVIFATGFHRYWSFFRSTISRERMCKENWCKFMLPIEEKKLGGIVFLIQTSSYGSTFPTMEMQSRWIAKQWADKKDFLERDYNKFRTEVKTVTGQLKKGQSYFHLPSPANYRDRLAQEIGCYPPIFKYLFSLSSAKRLLAICILFGPILPQHYRIIGPGSSEPTKDYIIDETKKFLGGESTQKIYNLWNVILVSLVVILIGIFLSQVQSWLA